MTSATISTSYNGLPVRGFLYNPVDISDSQLDVVVSYHPTIESPNVTPSSSAENFLNIILNQIQIKDKIIFSVAYPQDAIPIWESNPSLSSQEFPGLDYPNFYFGDNLPYAEAALLWVKNDLDSYFTSNGITRSINKIFTFGHSQGASLVHKLNTLHQVDGVISNAPGPIDLLARCSTSEANGDDNFTCKKIKLGIGSTLTAPNAYIDPSLKSYLSGTLSPVLFTQALDDTTGNAAGVPQVANMQNIMQVGLSTCINCQSVEFKYYSSGGHAAFVTNTELQSDIRTFIGSKTIPKPTSTPPLQTQKPQIQNINIPPKQKKKNPAFNLFGPPTKDDIKVAYIDPVLGLVEGVSICEANEYSKKEPGTTFIFRDGNQTLQYLNVNEINQLDPNVLTTTDECGGISQKKECGPPTIQIFGGGGIGAAGNPIVGNDGAILAVDIIRGGNGYQYPPLVSARDICNYGSGASFTTIIGEVVETTETFDNESDFEDYELCEPTDVGYGRRYGPDGEDLGSWDPKVYTEPGEDPIKKEVEEFEKIVRRLARAPFWTTRTAKPTKISCSDPIIIPSKYDVTDATYLEKQRNDGAKNPVGWNEFMNSYAISPVSSSNVRGSDFAGRLFTFEWTEDFPTDGEYIFRGLCDNQAQLFVDNLKVTDLAGFNAPVRPIQKTLTKGLHNIRVDLLNIPMLETFTTQTSTPSNLSNIQVKKVFNTLDFIGKANRTLWRTNVYGRGGFINEVGVCPFDTSVTLSDNPYAGTHTIIWNNINFPIDGSYRIRMAVDDSVTLFIGDEQIRYEGFIAGTNTPNAEFSVNKFFKAGNYTVRADLEQISGGQFGFSDSRNINPMALAIDIEVTTITETIVSPKSWNENPMGISVTIDAPEPPIPQEPVPEQEGRCPNNPIWTTRFPGAKEFWYPVQFNGSKSPQGKPEPWAKFFNRYAISPVPPLDTPGSDGGGVLFTNSWELEIPYDGFYQFAVQRDETARFYVDGQLAFDIKTAGDDIWKDFRNKPKFQKVFITKGLHTIGVELENAKTEVFEQVYQKIFRTKDWQSGSTSASGVTYEGPPLFAYKDNRWGTFMNNDSVSPLLPPLNADNPEINGVKTYSWKGVNFPESGQYDITFQADNDASLIINGTKVLSSRGYEGTPQIFKVNLTQGTYNVVVECNNIPDTTNIFNNNPTGFALVIRKNVSVISNYGKSWDENPMGVGAILIPPPCPRKISGKGVVTDVIVNDPGNGYLPPILPTTTSPSTLALIQTNVPGVSGGGAGAGAGGGTGAPGAGAGVPGAPGAGAVPLSIPSPPSGAPTGINASFRPQFEVVRDPVVIDPQKLLQVTDLVGLKQTGYVNGRAYYGSVYYDNGIRYAGFYETIGEPIRVYDTLRESIIAQVTTPPSAILRQGTDIRSNNPLLNIPGTVQSTLNSNSIVGAGDIFPPSVPFVQEPLQDPIYPVSLRLKRVLVEDPGINYNVTDQIRVIPSNGAVLEPVFGSFGRVIKVAVIDPGFGFTEYPRIEMFTPL